MGTLRRLLLRLLTVFRHGRSERELAHEVDAHLRELQRDFERRGLSPEEARRAARREFGGVEQVKEQQRDARSFRWLEDLRRDVAYGVRTLVEDTRVHRRGDAHPGARHRRGDRHLQRRPQRRAGSVSVLAIRSVGERRAARRLGSAAPRPVLPRCGVPRLSGAGDRVRRRGRHQPRLDALAERERRRAPRRRLDDRERLRLPGSQTAARPRVRGVGHRAGRAAGRGHVPPGVGAIVRRGPGRDRTHAGARRHGVDGRRRHAAEVRVEHRRSVASRGDRPP